MQTRIHIQNSETPVPRFRTGVSLHSHTLHSHETFDFIYRRAQHAGGVRWILKQVEDRYLARHKCELDLRRAWWTPPCAPYDAWLLETEQIERHLQLQALVSLTDHDSIEAPLSLRALDCCRDIPISVEWSVPFGATVFHLGVHNLRAQEAQRIFAGFQDITAIGRTAELGDVLQALTSSPEILVTFNHPCWDENRIGADRHAETAAFFLRNYGQFIHALELNGLRPWIENRRVLQMAKTLKKPIVSGGDRHGFEANTILDLTNAATFSEYVQEVRSGLSNVLVTERYFEPFRLRVLRNVAEILHDYDANGPSSRRWTDRVFYVCDDNVVRSLSELFSQGVPAPIQLFVNGIGLIGRYRIDNRIFRAMMRSRQEIPA
jgi:hypothetical protein